MASDRIPCCVPFCRRTADAEKFKGEEIICGKHWRLASATQRRRQSRMARMYRRRFGRNGYWEYPAGSPDRLDAVKLARILEKLWERCKRQAIERAAGL
jgi:hypothetical protein